MILVGDDWSEATTTSSFEAGERLAARRLPEGVKASPRCTS